MIEINDKFDSYQTQHTLYEGHTSENKMPFKYARWLKPGREDGTEIAEQ